MLPRISQAAIAQVAGVHPATVSLSLRDKPVIPAATRRRIQGIAEKLGYRPDPALRALVAYQGRRASIPQANTIAYLTNWDTRWGWRSAPAHARFYAGARRKADELGYQLEHFWLSEPGITHAQLSGMLAQRGISGVLLASHLPSCDRLTDFDWSRFSAVKIDYYPHVPALRHVTNNQRAVIRLAMRHVLAAGYQRIGFVLPRSWDAFVDFSWSAGFLAEQARLRSSDRVPLLLYDGDSGSTVPSRVFADWYERHRPAVIVSYAPFVVETMYSLGLSIPADVGYVDIFLMKTDGSVAGVYENCEQVGETAMELLSSELQQNVRGVPQYPSATLVEGTWVDGASLPAGPAFAQQSYAFSAVN